MCVHTRYQAYSYSVILLCVLHTRVCKDGHAKVCVAIKLINNECVKEFTLLKPTCSLCVLAGMVSTFLA